MDERITAELREFVELLQIATPEQKLWLFKQLEGIRFQAEIKRLMDGMNHEEIKQTRIVVERFVSLPEDLQAQLLQISEQMLATQQAEEKPTDGSDRQA